MAASAVRRRSAIRSAFAIGVRGVQAGADLEEVIRQIRGGSWTPSEAAYEFRNGSEVTSVFIEEGSK